MKKLFLASTLDAPIQITLLLVFSHRSNAFHLFADKSEVGAGLLLAPGASRRLLRGFHDDAILLIYLFFSSVPDDNVQMLPYVSATVIDLDSGDVSLYLMGVSDLFVCRFIRNED